MRHTRPSRVTGMSSAQGGCDGLGERLRRRVFWASTITRRTGSVPEARISTRPRPASSLFGGADRARPAAHCGVQSQPFGQRTLIRTCGSRVQVARAGPPASAPCVASPQHLQALTMPSPVVCLSRHSRWPGPFAAELPAFSRASPARSGRRPWRARTDAELAQRRSNAKLVISVPTTPGTGPARGSRSLTITYSSSSPL